METEQHLQYVGFWIRVVASLIDTVLMLMIIVPLVLSIYGLDNLATANPIQGTARILLFYVLPAIGILLFWSAKQATPGKMVFKAKIVDANNGGAPSTLQFLIRYLGYFVSILPLCLGLLWVAWDSRKQGWHDKLASTVVVRPGKTAGATEVRFPDLERTKPAPADDTA